MNKIRYELRIIWGDGSSSPWPQSKESESLRDYLIPILAREIPCKKQPVENCPKCGCSIQGEIETLESHEGNRWEKRAREALFLTGPGWTDADVSRLAQALQTAHEEGYQLGIETQRKP